MAHLFKDKQILNILSALMNVEALTKVSPKYTPVMSPVDTDHLEIQHFVFGLPFSCFHTATSIFQSTTKDH